MGFRTNLRLLILRILRIFYSYTILNKTNCSAIARIVLANNLMKTLISKFVAPQVEVRFSNLVVDSLKKHFSMTVGTRAAGKRKFTEKEISGNITADLADWFSLPRDEKVKVAADNEQGFEFIKTGRKLTNLQKYMMKRGIDEVPNILNQLVFEYHQSAFVFFVQRLFWGLCR